MLKKLELHGFKTFAGKTHFEFDQGITAIVGPNGSGKSNITDSLRWILGEQRATVLRARKGEDLIFSGTEKRARMGMAQGFVTLDNQEGLLPLDFSEIVVGRRAYRTGESEYLINGTRVRLRDVQELLAHAGLGIGTYTVIGQGLVDSALSLRAEERRQLFEDAAGLGAWQGKRDESLRRLSTTDEHLTRVRDIVGEIEPRLGRLKRQAERAEEYLSLKSTLDALLRHLYGYRWGEAAEALATANENTATGHALLAAAMLALHAVEEQADGLRRRQAERRAALEQGRRERGRLRAEAERLRRERAVAAERERGFERQRDTLQGELAALEAEAADLARRSAEADDEGAALHQRRREAADGLQAAHARLAGAEQERATLRQRLDEQRRALGRLTARQGEVAQQRAALTERERELGRERATHQQALATLAERLAEREAAQSLREAELATVQGQRTLLAEQRQSLLAERRAAQGQQRDAQATLHSIQRRLSELTARRDLLARLRREGVGYEAGVRALLAERGRFGNSVQGSVAEALRVPDEWSTAISAALGTLLQALVVAGDGAPVRRWLHGREAGRVTLLPLGDLRPAAAPPPPTAAGILGRAAELVGADAPALLEQLLGDWLVVEDWAAVERVAVAAQGWHLVTRDGQVRRRSGAVLAGRGAGQGSALLAQSREWAELPERLAEVEGEQRQAQAVLEGANRALHELEARLATLERDITEAERQVQRADSALARERRDAEALRQEQGWRGEGLAKLERDQSALAVRAAALATQAEQGALERQRGEAMLADVEQAWEAAHPGTLREVVERARTLVAVAEEQMAGWQRGRHTLDEAATRLAQRRHDKAAQAERLDTEEATLRQRLTALDEEASRAESALEQSLAQSRPLEAEQGQSEQQLAALDEQHALARTQRHEHESALHSARLALQAAEERLAHLRDTIEADLGMVEMADDVEGLAHQSLLPIEELVTSLPRVPVLPDGLENDVRRLRRRLGYIGAINPEAPTEYAEQQARYAFLSEQADDLARASADLRHVVAELDALMRSRFSATFAAIADAFAGYFTRLFGGGQARLELVEPDDPMGSGVEIIARPPGKRAQSIALLSGGERALTAAALIFAILKVSPAPFCVLDEVDAMLDEANVGRFRDLLQELAEQTQFVVVTHNRGTIEAARAIYGISQSDPGISEVISLHLDEAVRVAKQ